MNYYIPCVCVCVLFCAVVKFTDVPLQDGSLPEIVGVCDAQNSIEWLSVLFAYKGFVLLTGVFLAFETRKVNSAILNESRFIAMSIYGAVIVCIALTPIGFLLENFPNPQYGILGIMILISVTIILGLIFLSKVHKQILNNVVV